MSYNQRKPPPRAFRKKKDPGRYKKIKTNIRKKNWGPIFSIFSRSTVNSFENNLKTRFLKGKN